MINSIDFNNTNNDYGLQVKNLGKKYRNKRIVTDINSVSYTHLTLPTKA